MSQPFPLKQENQSGADYLRQILRAPVYEAAIVTPLQDMPRLSARIGNQVQLKREDRQPVHSFKLRGAYNMVSSLSDQQKAAGVIAASAGHHAQGMALSGSKLGIQTTIVMPKTTPDIKVDAVRGFGGNVVLHGSNFDEAKADFDQKLLLLENCLANNLPSKSNNYFCSKTARQFSAEHKHKLIENCFCPETV